MKSAVTLFGVSLVVVLGNLQAQQAYAQESPDDVLAVTRHVPDDISSTGTRVGGFILTPGVEVNSTYDDNIFRTQTGAINDVITDIKPSIGLQSNWNRHSLAFGAEGDFGTYKNNTQLNYNDYGLMASGQYDITYETDIIAAVTHAKRHEGVGTLISTNGGAPLSYTDDTQQLQFNRTLGLIKLIVTGRNESVLLSSDTNGSTTPILNDLTERNDKSLSATLRFEPITGNSAFVTTTYDKSHYSIAGSGDADSRGTDVRSGVTYNNNGTLNGSLYGGYMLRSYSGGVSDTTDPYFGCNINWDATPLTRFSIQLDKTFNQATVTDAAGVIHTSRKATIHQGFTTRLSGEITLGLDDNTYVGGTQNNLQTTVKYGELSGVYQFSEKVGVRLGYNREQRDASIAADNYKDNRFTISVIYMH